MYFINICECRYLLYIQIVPGYSDKFPDVVTYHSVFAFVSVSTLGDHVVLLPKPEGLAPLEHRGYRG